MAIDKQFGDKRENLDTPFNRYTCYKRTSSEAIMLIDTQNAFKRLFRDMDLKHQFNDLSSILLYVTHITNHEICLVTNKQYPLRQVQLKVIPITCQCMGLHNPLTNTLLITASQIKSGTQTTKTTMIT